MPLNFGDTAVVSVERIPSLFSISYAMTQTLMERQREMQMYQFCHSSTASGSSSCSWLAFFLLTCGIPILAAADNTVVSGDKLSVGASVEVGAGYFDTRGTNFGAGRVDFRDGDNTGDAQWAEGYLEPGLTGSYQLKEAGKLYGGISVVGAFTAGDGDPLGLTEGGDGDIDFESLFVGWSSGEAFADSWGEDVVDLSYGRQEFQVGDGLLIHDGKLDALDDGALWLAPRASFERTGLVRINTSPVRGDLFYLKSTRTHDYTELAGVNIEYIREGLGTFGAMYFHVLDSDEPIFWYPRDGVDVLSLRANEISVSGLKNLAFWGEYILETGDGKFGEKDATGWYVEFQYSFPAVAWAPRLSYRYASFSGDADPDDNKSKDFDPFFYGFSRNWGTWYQGEIVGNYLLFNNNQTNHMVHLAMSPTDALELGAIYFNFLLDKKNYFGTPVTSDDFADEINLYADWTISDKLSASAVYGVVFPGDAAKQAFEDDDPFHLFQVFLTYSL